MPQCGCRFANASFLKPGSPSPALSATSGTTDQTAARDRLDRFLGEPGDLASCVHDASVDCLPRHWRRSRLVQWNRQAGLSWLRHGASVLPVCRHSVSRRRRKAGTCPRRSLPQRLGDRAGFSWSSEFSSAMSACDCLRATGVRDTHTHQRRDRRLISPMNTVGRLINPACLSTLERLSICHFAAWTSLQTRTFQISARTASSIDTAVWCFGCHWDCGREIRPQATDRSF